MDTTNKSLLNMRLHSISKVYNEDGDEDPTLIKVKFIILTLDEVSGNNQIITYDEGVKMASTMKLKPLTCQYFPTTDYENPNDRFQGHGAYKDKFRIGGQEFMATNSFAIGVCQDGAYVEEFDDNGEVKQCLVAEYYLWGSRYPNIISLIDEIYQSGEDLYSSCEYLYSNYTVKDGITYPQDLIFDGHCILGEKSDGTKVQPAFEMSKLISFNERWNKAISEVLNKEMNEKKEERTLTIEERLKVLNELSHEDIRSKLYKALSEKLTANEFNSIWISHYNIFDTFFLYEIYNYEEEKYEFYKVGFTKNEDDTVTVDVEGREKVERQTVWVSVNELQKVQNEKTEVENKVVELEKSLNEKEEMIKSLNETIEGVNGEKVTLETKFNEVSEKVITLNSKVEELQPLVDEYNKEKYEKALNEKIDYYKSKFESLNAKEKFESEEVQGLIKKSLNDSESTLSLNSMLVDLVQVEKKEESNNNKIVKELNSKIENLIPKHNQSVEEKYGF